MYKGVLCLSIGGHLSISKGYLHMGKEATKLVAIPSNTLHPVTLVGGGMRALDVEGYRNSLCAYMKEHNLVPY